MTWPSCVVIFCWELHGGKVTSRHSGRQQTFSLGAIHQHRYLERANWWATAGFGNGDVNGFRLGRHTWRWNYGWRVLSNFCIYIIYIYILYDIYIYILIIDDMMILIMLVLEYYDLSFFTAIHIKSFNSVNQSIFLGLVLCCILVGVLCCRISTNLRELVGMIRNLSSLKSQCLNTSWTNGTWKDSCPKNVDRKIAGHIDIR